MNKHLPEIFLMHLQEENVINFTVEMLSSLLDFPKAFDFFDARTCLNKFYNLKTSTPDSQFGLYFELPSINERIINQYAAFSFMNNSSAQIDQWLEKHETKYYRKIEIPSELKLKIKDRLDMSNITEKVLFSGLDGLSFWLKRHYSNLKKYCY